MTFGVESPTAAGNRYEDEVRAHPTDRDLVLEAADKDRYALLHAVKPFRSDREIVVEAVRHCGDSILLTDLQDDREVVLEAASSHGDSVRYADKKYRNDPEVMLAAVTNDGLSLRYGTDKIKDNQEVVTAACRQTGRALRHASPRLRGMLEVVMVALWQDNAAYAYVSNEVKETAYALDLESCICCQPLDGLSTKSEWTKCSKAGLIAFTVFGPTLYAVGEDGRLYKQLLVTMSPESAWLGPLTSPETPMASIAIHGGFLYAVLPDRRVYKQVLAQLSTTTAWSGPISDERLLSNISVHGSEIYGIGLDAKIYKQPVSSMCNISKWTGPLSNTMDVKTISFFGNKVYGLSTDLKVHWQLAQDFGPHGEWRLASQGDVVALTVCNTDLRMACEEMLEEDWRAKGRHLERRAAAAKAQRE